MKSESDSTDDSSSLTCACRQRTVLTREQAREIFRLKFEHGSHSLHSASVQLARTYKVSSKAIRDIWKGRSWLDATFDLWSEKDRPERKIIGRPKGKKDTKQRVRSNPKKIFSQRPHYDSNFQFGNKDSGDSIELRLTQEGNRLPSIRTMLRAHTDSIDFPKFRIDGTDGAGFALPVPFSAAFQRSQYLDPCYPRFGPLAPQSLSPSVDILAATILYAQRLSTNSPDIGASEWLAALHAQVPSPCLPRCGAFQ